MKKISLLVIAGFIMILNLSARNISYETASFKLDLNDKGEIVSILDKLKNTEYLPAGQIAPLLSIRVKGVLEYPSMLRQKNNILTLSFNENKVEAQVRVITKSGYISFELIDLTKTEIVELVVWGPYPTSIRETIGECVGVVRDKQFAIGIQSLNVKTLGG